MFSQHFFIKKEYEDIYIHTHSGVKKFLPLPVFFFAWFRLSNKFKFYTKITWVKTKCSFEIKISFIKGKKAVQTCLALREKVIAP